jgi:hypothetical protein
MVSVEITSSIMKNKTATIVVNGLVHAAILLVVFPIVIAAMAQSGGDYELSWYTIDGGGGRSSGGSYVLTGTIGQPDAAYSAGGNYELLGGFWPGGPLCIVQFDDFARFAELWRASGEGLPADLDGSCQVDFEDLRQFADWWLSCCPVGWPLK